YHSLSGEHKMFNALEVNWRGSYSRTQQEFDRDMRVRFRETAAFANDINDRLPPEEIPQFALNNIGRTGVHDSRYGENSVTEQYYSAQVDLKYPFANRYLNGFIKTGAKLRNTDREREAR